MFMTSSQEKHMSLNARINAAAAAVAAHTDALGIDDAGDPAGIGAWHLLYSLYDYCDRQGIFPLDVIAVTEQDWDFDKPFLVMVAKDYGRITPGMPTAWEYEVSASTLEEACLKVVSSPARRKDAERRIRHEAYTDRYMAPNWDGYAGGAVIGEGRPDTIKDGIRTALELEWLPKAFVPDISSMRPEGLWPEERDPAGSAAYAIGVYRAATWDYDADELRMVENLLRGLREYMTRYGEDFDEMLRDVRSERAFIQGHEAAEEDAPTPSI
jgi:hypothetical protein